MTTDQRQTCHLLLILMNLLLRSKRSSTSLGLVLGQDLFIDVCSLLSLLQVSLDLPELGQVEGSDLVGFLNLLLVALHLVLQFVNQLLHTFLVLLVLILGEGQLLDTSLSSSVGLLSVNKTSLFIIKLTFKILNLLLKSGDNLLASLDCQLLSLVQLGLHVLHLVVQDTSASLCHLSILLLSSEFISKSGSINHSLLGFLLRNSRLCQHFL